LQEDPELRRTLWFLLGGKRGGENRARIIWSLRDKPRNINQLATDLGLQYKAVQHHIRILVGSSLLSPSGEGYGVIYLPSQWFDHHFDEFVLVCEKLGFGRTGHQIGEQTQESASRSESGVGPDAPRETSARSS